MPFVFYDTETTGISTDFDQILQFAAIRTDDDLNEIDRLELRCRLHPHVVPHPSALKVTGMSINRLIDTSLPCHYAMMRQIQSKMVEWSPAMFVGYNSMRFDEQLLRQALFRTLHPPYLTNTSGNSRADALMLVQAAVEFIPGCLNVPLGAKGKPSFRLDALAPSNGFAHLNAHDALADVEATIHIARCVQEQAPTIWTRFLQFSTKTASLGFVNTQDAFVLTEFYFNRPYHFKLSALGTHPNNPSAIAAFDLKFDPESAAALNDDELLAWLSSGDKPIRQVRLNAAPCLSAIDEVPVSCLDSLSRETLFLRAARLRADSALRGRLLSAFAKLTPPNAASDHIEEQIYAGFPSNSDQVLMANYHRADWSERVDLVEQMADERLRYHGRRLIHEERPDLLPEKVRNEVEAHIGKRLLMQDAPRGKWTSIPDALTAAQHLIANNDEECRAMMDEFTAYLVELTSRYQKKVEYVDLTHSAYFKNQP